MVRRLAEFTQFTLAIQSATTCALFYIRSSVIYCPQNIISVVTLRFKQQVEHSACLRMMHTETFTGGRLLHRLSSKVRGLFTLMLMFFQVGDILSAFGETQRHSCRRCKEIKRHV